MIYSQSSMKPIHTTKQLLEKNTSPLAEQVKEAIQQKKVLTLYQPSPGRKPDETPDHYINRVRDEAKETQIVSVPFDGQTQKTVLLKISSGCYSGMVLGDMTCDCKQQLDEAEKVCVENTSGVIVEIPRQDGRGWGEYKMANQRLMDDLGMTTMQAAQAFYGDDTRIDRRTYKECAIILRAFGFREEHTLDLATSNPSKVNAFTALGFQVQNTRAILPSHITEAARRNRQSKLEHWKK